MKLAKALQLDPDLSDMLKFHFHGCNEEHWVSVGPNSVWKISWQFNGDFDNPTINPSILVRHGGSVCHSFIRDGKIQFLSDCTHELKGHTVELPDID